MATLLDEKSQADNFVEEMMHHDTLCLTGGCCGEKHSVML